MTPLMVVDPAPVPELTTKPVLFTVGDETVMPPVELAFRVKFWEPVMAPESVNKPDPEEVKEFRVLFSAKAELTVKGLEPACVIAVTEVPIVVAEMSAVAVLAPMLVIVPALLMVEPERVIEPPAPATFREIFPVPVIVPEAVSVEAAPLVFLKLRVLPALLSAMLPPKVKMPEVD